MTVAGVQGVVLRSWSMVRLALRLGLSKTAQPFERIFAPD